MSPKATIIIGADHRGFHLKNELVKELRARGYVVIDKGDERLDPEDDYPQFAARVVNAMKSSDEDTKGLLLCGSGQGMAMAANRHKGIRAVVAWDKNQARVARSDDDSNVLALPADIFDKKVDEAVSIIETWLNTPFEAIPRRMRRIQQMDSL